MPRAKSLKVLISGGGIAGNALAFWLSRLGHDITVVERFPTLRTTGLQLDLRGHGVQVMRRMGLEEAFRAKSAPEEGMQVVDRTGRRRAWFPANKSGKGSQDLTSEFEMMRGDLCRLLHDAALEPGSCDTPPRYTFGTSVAGLDQQGDGRSVDVRFEDGRTERFDLVVGADGQWSRTRRLMLGSDKTGAPDGFHPAPGLYFAYFTISRPMQAGEEYISTLYLAPGNKGIMARRHSPDKMAVMLSCKTHAEGLKNVPRGDVKGEKEVMAREFRGAGWIAEDIVRLMMDADDFYCERVGLVRLDPWSHGRVTLVGDAAYCPTVLTGMGTTAAFMGAYILAGEIGRHCGPAGTKTGARGDGVATDIESPDCVEAALKSYEQKLRPFMDHVQKGVLENAQKQHTMAHSAWSIALVNWAMGLASFFKVNFATAWGVRETLKGWDLPEYKELHQDHGGKH